MSTRVTELTSYTYEVPGEPVAMVQNLIALGWEVEEEQPDRTLLRHDLMPGARRIVHI